MQSARELFSTVGPTGDDEAPYRRRLTPEEADRLPYIHRLLLGYFGEQEAREPWDPLSQFIYSLLSSRTKTEVTYQVVRHLRERFGTWENLRDASLAEIEDGIRDVTFPEQKA